MKWKDIQQLSNLTTCPCCNNIITNSIIVTKTNKSYLQCNICNCEMFEINSKLWYIVPDKIVIKQEEITKCYERSLN